MIFRFQRLRTICTVLCVPICSTVLIVGAFGQETAQKHKTSARSRTTTLSTFDGKSESDFIQLTALNQACAAGGSACAPSVGCAPLPAYSLSPFCRDVSPGGAGMNSATGETPPATSVPTQTSPSSIFNAPDSGALGNPNYIAAAASPGGYLDLAAPVTQFRLRYDDALNNQAPDRGEYFYAQCGCFRDLAGNQNAKGPSGINNSVNYQAVRSYFEYAFTPKFSVFAEVPFEWINFNAGAADGTNGGPLKTFSPVNSSGLADMNAGFKYALIASPKEYLTFQLRTYIPTGDSYQGLGNAHVSIEPGLLYYNRLNDRWILQAEFKEFAPINASGSIGNSGYASNVIEYGGGLGYILLRGKQVVVTPTLETVGWTFFGGQVLPANGAVQSANGETIVNVKPGVRIGFGDVNAPSGQQRQSLYFGWGHALTTQQFYKDIFRIEYRILF